MDVNLAPFDTTRSQLLPLLEGAAFSAIHDSPTISTFYECKQLLQARFGKDEDEAASLLVNTK